MVNCNDIACSIGNRMHVVGKNLEYMIIMYWVGTHLHIYNTYVCTCISIHIFIQSCCNIYENVVFWIELQYLVVFWSSLTNSVANHISTLSCDKMKCSPTPRLEFYSGLGRYSGTQVSAPWLRCLSRKVQGYRGEGTYTGTDAQVPAWYIAQCT